LIHALCKNNHYYLYDSIDKKLKNELDINSKDKNRETPLSIALNDKSSFMIERILRDFKDKLEFTRNDDSEFIH
jgi:hypothetical protein